MYRLMSRLTIEISNEEHRKIKTLAGLSGQTIEEFVRSRIFEENFEKDNDWQEFKDLMLERILDAENSDINQKSIKDIVKEELSSQK